MIHSTSNHSSQPGAVGPVGTRPAARPATAPAASQDTLDTSASAALREALSALPEVRTEVVERGQGLAVDPNYPPRAIIEDIARLIVNTNDPSEVA